LTGTSFAQTATSMAVASMVDVMKQFDSNGNLLGAQSTLTASIGNPPKLASALDPANNGFLAAANNKLAG